MRSLLFIPGRRREEARQGRGLRRRRADPRSGGRRQRAPQGGRAPDRRPVHRGDAGAGRRPLLYVRINALDTPYWEADLAGVIGGRPDGILLPKARSGADVHTLSIALNHAEERAGAKGRRRASSRWSTEVPISLLQMHTYVGSSARLEGLTWGAEDLSGVLGAHTNREADGQLDLALSAGAQSVPVHGGRRRRAAHRHRVRQFPRRGGPARRGDRGRARRLHRQDGDPPQPGGGHQRGVHAERRSRSRRPRRSSRHSPTTRRPACSAFAGRWWIAPTSPGPSASWPAPGRRDGRVRLSSRCLSPGSSNPQAPRQVDGWIPGTRPGMTRTWQEGR